MNTPKAVPTATGIQPIRRRRVFPVHAESPSILDFETSIPTLHCQVTEGGAQVRFRCGLCNRFHLHGNVPRNSANKGHRVSHCGKGVYPNGYFLRTDLDKIYQKRYPNFAFIPSGTKAFNAHYRKCKRLGLPMVSIRKDRNYAMVEVDFITTNYRMNETLSLMIDLLGTDYRRLRQSYAQKRKSLGFLDFSPRGGRDLAMFWIFVNDAYLLAEILMPLVNNTAHWIRCSGGRP